MQQWISILLLFVDESRLNGVIELILNFRDKLIGLEKDQRGDEKTQVFQEGILDNFSLSARSQAIKNQNDSYPSASDATQANKARKEIGKLQKSSDPLRLKRVIEEEYKVEDPLDLPIDERMRELAELFRN